MNTAPVETNNILFEEIQRIQAEVLASQSEGGELPESPSFDSSDPLNQPASDDLMSEPTPTVAQAVPSVRKQGDSTAESTTTTASAPAGTLLAFDSDGVEASGVERSTEVGTVEESLTKYIRALLASASESDAPLRHHLTLAIVLAMTSPQQVFEPEGLAELTDQEQELVRIMHQQFKALGSELDAGGDSATVLQHLQALIGMARVEQSFKISRLALCTRVRDFGVIDPVEPPVFDPAERSSFIWYLELDGFEPFHDAEEGTWLYEFDLRLEMLTRDTGVPVIAPLQNTVRHQAGSEVQDFYLRDLFKIPQNLQFDWYTTKLTVIDRKSGAQAQQSTDFLWVPNLAAGGAHLQRQAVVSTSD